jgi:hypothetical protein
MEISGCRCHTWVIGLQIQILVTWVPNNPSFGVFGSTEILGQNGLELTVKVSIKGDIWILVPRLGAQKKINSKQILGPWAQKKQVLGFLDLQRS